MEKIDIAVIGAGVIGLSVAAKLSESSANIFILEKNPAFGQETSSRNSEVIHAGIYYPKNSLKARTCLEGKDLLYEFCVKNNIPHKKTGKLIAAIKADEIKDLEILFRQGLDNGAQDLQFLSAAQVKNLEPNIRAEAAIYSPATGILDTHQFMKALEAQFRGRGGNIAYAAELAGVEKTKEGFLLTAKDEKENFKFLSRILINCAGLNSDKISVMAGVSKEEYKLKYCKGDYFRVAQSKAKFINRLVYPVPKKAGAGLGVHATLDLGGSLRLGPDDEYVKEINYEVNPEKARDFYESTREFLPFIELGDITADTSGIRPKLQGPGEGFRDFIIKDEAENGIPGLINLIGIESPGFTAALSIARIVAGLVDKF